MTDMRLTCGKCDEGWICEEHPDQPMDHDDCAGAGIPCDNPTCPYRIDRRPVQTFHGLVCPTCREPVAEIACGPGAPMVECPVCGIRWASSETKTQ